MKLFETRPNVIRTFGLRINQCLIVSNIDLSDILETPSFFVFVLPPWCIKPPKILLGLVHLKTGRTNAFVYQQLFTDIRNSCRDYITVDSDGSQDEHYLACATMCPLDTVIAMRLPDTTFIFTAEVWAIIKTLEHIKDQFASKCIIFTDSLSCIHALQYMKLEHILGW